MMIIVLPGQESKAFPFRIIRRLANQDVSSGSPCNANALASVKITEKHSAPWVKARENARTARSQRSQSLPGQVNVDPARDAMVAPKNKKPPMAVIPRGPSRRTTLEMPELGQSRIC